VEIMAKNSRRWIGLVAFFVFAVYGGAKSLQPSPYLPDRTPRMDNIPPKIAKLFEKTRPVCFSHFVIDVPINAQVVWGPLLLPHRTTVYPNFPNAQNYARRMINEKVKEITSQKHRTEPSMLIGVFDSVNEDSKIVVGYTFSYNEWFVDLYSYIRLNQLVLVQSIQELGLSIDSEDTPSGRKHDKNVYKTVSVELKEIASRFRYRRNDEIPTTPGVCIESGFLAKKQDEDDKEFSPEIVSVGFRFPEYPDVTFSVQTRNTDKPSNDDTLEAALERGSKHAGVLGLGDLYAKIRRIRQGERVIAGWEGGEALGRMPGQKGGPSTHEFMFKSKGVGMDLLRPSVSIDLYTGVKDDETASVKPSLTDDEAVALWDKLTASIRVRPVAEPKPPSRPA
jgi:hypothetical protein